MLRRSLQSAPDEPVSHNPSARKRVLARNGEIPGITQIARARIPAGETAPAHAHIDMWEVFLCESGHGIFLIDGTAHPVTTGDCLVIQPGESHEVQNPGPDPLVLTVTGILTNQSPEKITPLRPGIA